MRIILSFVVALGTLALVGAEARATPPNSGQITFFSNRSGSNEIYTMRPDGSGVTRLTSVVGPNRRPRWSPNGKKIAFASRRDGSNFEIYVMNPDGSAQTRVTHNTVLDDYPAWTVDSKRIVFQRGGFSNGDILVANPDGSNEQNLTGDQAGNVTPATSPRDRRIAFASERSGPDDIWTMLDDGSNLQQVTSGPDSDFNPSWSPQAKDIAFLRDSIGTDNDIYVVHPDGSGLRRLTNTPNRAELGPSWSPDGKRIIFSGCGASSCHLFSIAASGGDETQLTNLSFDPPPSAPYSETFDTGFNPNLWTSFGPTGSGSPGPTVSPVNARLEFSFPADTGDDPVAAVQMISRCSLAGDFDFQIDYGLLDWPTGNGVVLALSAESATNYIAIARRSDPQEEDYGAAVTPAVGTPTGSTQPTGDQQGTLRLVRSGAFVSASVLVGGVWQTILASPAPTDELQIALTTYATAGTFAGRPVKEWFDNFKLNTGSFDLSTCSIDLGDQAPDWQAR